jgi:hypothetical protein
MLRLVVGKRPNADPQRLCDLSLQAMAAAEKELRAGAACKTVDDRSTRTSGRSFSSESTSPDPSWRMPLVPV